MEFQHVYYQHPSMSQGSVDVREALNHFRTSTKIAETAFEVISRCRATSISSFVGGVAFVSATYQLPRHAEPCGATGEK